VTLVQGTLACLRERGLLVAMFFGASLSVYTQGLYLLIMSQGASSAACGAFKRDCEEPRPCVGVSTNEIICLSCAHGSTLPRILMSQKSRSVLEDIQEVNLSYLLLAQRLLRENLAQGMFRLGLREDVAERILNLSPAQTIKLAASSTLICGFRLNQAQCLNALTQDSLGGILQQAHAAILLTQQEPCEALAA